MVVHYIYSRFVLKVKLYDDKFMFGSIIVTSIIAEILVFSYSYNWLRFTLLGVGFASFLFVYRGFIISWIAKRKVML